MMLILTACRRGYEADQLVRSGQWQGWSPTQLLGVGLTGRRLLIFGMGRIGREIAKRARAFGMQIHYHNRRRLDPDQEMGALFHENLDNALSNADIVMVAAPGSPALKGIINAESIARMPDGSVLINISRGDLVDDDALINALNSGKLFSAGLDVFSNEPHVDARYFALKNVFLTPHIGSATRETRDAMGWMLVNGLEQLRQGQQPSNLISTN
jgi:glyoxylate reductase